MHNFVFYYVETFEFDTILHEKILMFLHTLIINNYDRRCKILLNFVIFSYT